MDFLFEKSFGDRLRLAINNKFSSQKEFAEEFDIKQNTLSNYITGRTEPDIKTIVFLAESLDVTLEWLLTGKGKHEIISSYFDLELWDNVVDVCLRFSRKNKIVPTGRFFLVTYQSLLEEKRKKLPTTIEDILTKHKAFILSQKK